MIKQEFISKLFDLLESIDDQLIYDSTIKVMLSIAKYEGDKFIEIALSHPN